MKRISRALPTVVITVVVLFAGHSAGASLIDAAAEQKGPRSSRSLPSEPEFIFSGQTGDLKKPSLWTCDYLLPEYKAWLEEGNSPNDWRMVGKTYVDLDTEESYDWTDWLNWIDENNCSPVALARPEALPVFGSLLGPLLGVGAVGGAAATTGNDSPG